MSRVDVAALGADGCGADILPEFPRAGCVTQSPASCLLFLHVLLFALRVSHGPCALTAGQGWFRPPQSLSSPGILPDVNNHQPYGLTYLTGKKTKALGGSDMLKTL